MKLRSFALCAVLSLLCAYCNSIVGGGYTSKAQPPGSTCSQPSDCASFMCNGTCQPPPAGQVGIDDDCSGGQQCIEVASCQDGICVQDKDACVGDGQSCFEGTCCDGYICNENDVCVSGGGAGGSGTGGSSSCAETGASCNFDTDCCSTHCDTSSNTCTSNACAATGDFCNVDSDCCSDLCDTGLNECE